MAQYSNNELISMSCGHKVDKRSILTEVKKTLQTKNEYDIKCPKKYCGQIWDLWECSEALGWSEDKYTHYATEFEVRASPETKNCPFCRTECEAPDVSFTNRVHCSSCNNWIAWCWLCELSWKTRDYTDCGNPECQLNRATESNNNNNNIYYHTQNTSTNQAKYMDNYIDTNTQDDVMKNKTQHYINDPLYDDKNEQNNVSHSEEDTFDANNNEDDEGCDEKTDDWIITTNKAKHKGQHPTKQSKGKKNKKKDKKIKTKEIVKMGKGIVGLSNLGNTCFMNSALQCMLQSPLFIESFFFNQVKLPTTSSRYFGKSSIDQRSLSYIWSSFIKEIYGKNYGSIRPINIKSALNRLNPVIGNGSQEDAFCVIETLLQGLDDELFPNSDGIYDEFEIYNKRDIPSHNKVQNIVNKLWSSYTEESKQGCAVVRECFDGIECEILTCPDCNYQLRAFQQFRHIQLPLCNKNISLKIKVYIPELNDSPLDIPQFPLAFDNTIDGLKYIILSKLPEQLNIDKKTVNLKFGYIHPSNNNETNDVNEWIRYLTENDNCAKIKNYSTCFAVIYSQHNQFNFIPTFNLVANERDMWKNNVIDMLTFTKLHSSQTMISGAEMIKHQNEKNIKGLTNYDPAVIYYDNRLLTNNPNHAIKINKRGCLLRIWIHRRFPKQKPSPSNVNINLDANDYDVIQRALQQSSKHRALSIENVMNALQHYWQQLTTFDLRGLVPGFSNSDNNTSQQRIENEKNNARLVFNKLKQLSESEKLANKWLRFKVKEMKTHHEKERLNYTKPRMLDNLAECLDAYEMKETSDGNGIDCQRCQDCPQIASRQVEIVKTPKILLIHIDREQAGFSDTHSSKKRDDLIKYPVRNLKFSKDTYDLFGVVEHYGYGTDGGHYVCYVKSLQNQQWFKMNDSQTRQISNERNVITKDASVLLYHRTSPVKQ